MRVRTSAFRALSVRRLYTATHEVFETDSFRASSQEAGRRIDVILADRYQDVSRSYLARLCQDGFVSLNDEPGRKSRKVRAGDHVSVSWAPAPEIKVIPEDLDLDVLAEDAEVIFINKRAGLVVHPAPGHPSGTLVNGVMHHIGGQLPDGASESSVRPGIVHRLDIGTSGVIVVAKTASALQHMQKAFHDRRVRKSYLAICGGDPTKGAKEPVVVEHPIGRHRGDKKKMAVISEDRGGRHARSIVTRLGGDETRTLVHVALETGRTHQIRVHLQALLAPIIGDEAYGYRHFNRDATALGVSRPLLHARRLQVHYASFRVRVRVKMRTHAGSAD